MMNNGEEDLLRQQYLEAIRLYLYYKGSPFSYNKGKASARQAEMYRNLVQDLYEKYLRHKQ